VFGMLLVLFLSSLGREHIDALSRILVPRKIMLGKSPPPISSPSTTLRAHSGVMVSHHCILEVDNIRTIVGSNDRTFRIDETGTLRAC